MQQNKYALYQLWKIKAEAPIAGADKIAKISMPDQTTQYSSNFHSPFKFFQNIFLQFEIYQTAPDEWFNSGRYFQWLKIKLSKHIFHVQDVVIIFDIVTIKTNIRKLSLELCFIGQVFKNRSTGWLGYTSKRRIKVYRPDSIVEDWKLEESQIYCHARKSVIIRFHILIIVAARLTSRHNIPNLVVFLFLVLFTFFKVI